LKNEYALFMSSFLVEEKNFLLLSSIFMTAFGACLGSFVGLIIDRLPKGRSIITPPSHCSNCSHKLRVWQNIPIFSWLILRGKCFYCLAPIGMRLIILELLVAIAMLALFIKFGLSIALIERIIFVFILICLTYIDIDTLSLPYSLLVMLLLTGIVLSIVYYFNPGAYVAPNESVSILKLMIFRYKTIYSLSDRLLGGLVGMLFLSIINIFATIILRRTKRLSSHQWAMGWGDPWLVMAIGIFVGLSHLILVIFLASSLGTIFGLINQCFHKNEHGDDDIATGALPFGPFLTIAAIYVYLF
jgi:leader peptidase (prepilin peptidase) / N-methyltransferase